LPNYAASFESVVPSLGRPKLKISYLNVINKDLVSQFGVAIKDVSTHFYQF